jgi:hypothetical protein
MSEPGDLLEDLLFPLPFIILGECWIEKFQEHKYHLWTFSYFILVTSIYGEHLLPRPFLVE